MRTTAAIAHIGADYAAPHSNVGRVSKNLRFSATPDSGVPENRRRSATELMSDLVNLSSEFVELSFSGGNEAK